MCSFGPILKPKGHPKVQKIRRLNGMLKKKNHVTFGMIQKLFNVVFPLLFDASFLLPQEKNVSPRRFKSPKHTTKNCLKKSKKKKKKKITD